MLQEYQKHVEERAAEGLPPLPLDAKQVSDIIEGLKQPQNTDREALVYATELLGTMMGGYNIQPLIELLDYDATAEAAEKALSKIVMVYDAYHDVVEKAETNQYAKRILQSWAEAEWFLSRPALAEAITLTVLKVPGETNTDDLSPATEAWSRPDIPLHAKAMLVSKMPDALDTIISLKQKGHPIAYVGDVVGTGSSRKSAINSVLWHMGHDVAYVPNKRQGGVILGNNIAPIFFNTAEDSGALPIECNVDQLETGDVITIKPYEGKIYNEAGDVVSEFTYGQPLLLMKYVPVAVSL